MSEKMIETGIAKLKTGYQITYRINGVRHREGRIRTLQQARDIRAQRVAGAQLGELQDRSKPFPKFTQVADEYLIQCRFKRRKSICEVEHRLNGKEFGLKHHFGNRRLNQILPASVEEYKGLILSMRSVASANRYLSVLRRIFNVASEGLLPSVSEQMGKRLDNPVKKVGLEREHNERTRFLTPSEYMKLKAECSGILVHILEFAIHTGMRRSEILSLDWRNVDLRRLSILVEDSKNGESREIPINSLLREVISALQSIRRLDVPSVFHRNGKRVLDVRTAFESAVERAEIEDFTFHDLRHTFASWQVMAGTDLRTLQELLGHKTAKMTMRYAHLADDHKRNAIERQRAYIEEQLKKAAVDAK